MPQVEPEKIVGWLQNQSNKYGDFLVSKSWKDDKYEYHFSKWTSVQTLWHTDAGLQFLSIINHIQIPKWITVIDLDHSNEAQMNFVCDDLDKRKKTYACFNTPHGFHIWVEHTGLQYQTKKARESSRQRVISNYNGDLQKANDSCMIAFPFNPHWKSGEEMKLLRGGLEWLITF